MIKKFYRNLVSGLFGKLGTKQKATIAAAAFMIILFFAAKVAFWVLIFVFIASIAEIYNHEFRTPIHFDLVKLGTVLTSTAYGAPAGIFVGIASTFFSKMFSSRLSANIIVSFVGIIIISLLAHAFSGAPITALGISLVFVYYLITSPIILMMGENPAYAALYVFSSIVINILLFSLVAPKLIRLL